MSRYAEQTSVSVERSISEIKRTLERYGASRFVHGEDNDAGTAMIGFSAYGRIVRFELTLPARDLPEFTATPTGKKRAPDLAEKDWERACRQRWRALALAIKAKLEAVESEIAVFEDEFMAYVVDPVSGQTLGKIMRPQIERAYISHTPIRGIAGLLPAPKESDEH